MNKIGVEESDPAKKNQAAPPSRNPPPSGSLDWEAVRRDIEKVRDRGERSLRGDVLS